MGTHDLGRAAVDEVGAVPLGDAGVGLGHHEQVGVDGTHLGDGGFGVGEVVAAVGADGGHAERGEALRHVGAGDPHHRAAGGVEAERRDDRQVADGLGAEHGGLDLLERAHRLDPQEVGAALGEPLGLVGERLLGRVHGHRAHRLEQLTRRAHRTGDQNLAVRGVGGTTAVGGCGGVDLDDLLVEVVQLQTEAGAAERVREHDVGTRGDVALVHGDDRVRVREVHSLGRVAGLEFGGEQLGAHRTVHHQHVSGAQQFSQTIHEVPIGRRRTILLDFAHESAAVTVDVRHNTPSADWWCSGRPQPRGT